MKVKVLRNFKDLKENKFREVNEVFEATKERVEEINSTPHGALVEGIPDEGTDETEDMTVEDKIIERAKKTLESCTMEKLKEFAKEIKLPNYSKMNKKELVEALAAIENPKTIEDVKFLIEGD